MMQLSILLKINGLFYVKFKTGGGEIQNMERGLLNINATII